MLAGRQRSVHKGCGIWKQLPARRRGSLAFKLGLLLVSFLLASSSTAHSSNHAVIVSSSRYWFNYRHVINALSIYTLLKDHGVEDSNIVLMLADEYASNPRNPSPNKLLASGKYGRSLYTPDIEIDYRGEDVSVENLVRVLTGKPGPSSLPVLQSDSNAHVLVYLTGHGGDGFFKFQDFEEILATQLAAVVSQMHRDGRYREMLIIADTCQAFTLGKSLTAPNVTMIGSSLKGESSYAHHSDPELGLSVIERYTHAVMEHLSRKGLEQTIQQSLVDPYTYATQKAHIGVDDSLAVRKITEVKVREFFANGQTTKETGQLVDDKRLWKVGPPPAADPPDVVTRRSSAEIPFDGEATLKEEQPPFWPGMEPSSPVFGAFVVVLLSTVAWASTMW